MITALIRTHPGREASCLKAVDSCEAQGVGYGIMFDHQGPRNDYSYNLLCNDLKATVPADSFFFYLDSDDTIIPDAIDQIKPHLTDPNTAYIVQFLRNGKPKPCDVLMDDRKIIKGRIGMPCIILHESKKHIADFGATEDADYLFIKEVSERMKVKFIKVALVNSPKRGYGK